MKIVAYFGIDQLFHESKGDYLKKEQEKCFAPISLDYFFPHNEYLCKYYLKHFYILQ